MLRLLGLLALIWSLAVPAFAQETGDKVLESTVGMALPSLRAAAFCAAGATTIPSTGTVSPSASTTTSPHWTTSTDTTSVSSSSSSLLLSSSSVQLSLFPTLPSRFHLLRSGRETRDKGDIDARCRPRIAIHCPLERDPYMSLRIRAFLGTR